jgi:alcohol dehydrogenase class IV
VIADKAAVIARVLDLPAQGFDGFFAWVLQMRRDLSIPHSLAEIGVNTGNAGVIGSEAAIDPSAGGNPIPVDAAQLEHIFRAAVAGKIDDVVSA